MITHDLSTAARFADRICVMYLGRIVEEGPAREVDRESAPPVHEGAALGRAAARPAARGAPQILRGETRTRSTCRPAAASTRAARDRDRSSAGECGEARPRCSRESRCRIRESSRRSRVGPRARSRVYAVSGERGSATSRRRRARLRPAQSGSSSSSHRRRRHLPEALDVVVLAHRVASVGLAPRGSNDASSTLRCVVEGIRQDGRTSPAIAGGAGSCARSGARLADAVGPSS